MKTLSSNTRFLCLTITALVVAAPVFAAAPGITTANATFNLTAQDAYLNQPDGAAVYSWGYGCASGFVPTFLPTAIGGAGCSTMQVPGPTLIVTEGQTVTINLTNNLPVAAGNTSMLFPGFQVTTACPSSTAAGAPQQGLLTCEAAPSGTVTYSFKASVAGTHAYYSGTQGDLQVEMGLYGAIIVLPANVPANCGGGVHAANQSAKTYWGETDYRLSQAAYDHPATCYDREYLFQWAEIDPNIHKQALAQAYDPVRQAACTVSATGPGCTLNVPTEPYHPAYFLINGRSMPDLMDPNYAGEYPHQPYNANPHMHPGELTLIRTIGQGRWQHPFHEHANHVRILARDGNLVLSNSTLTYVGSSSPAPALAGLLMFNTDTTPGQAFDGIFYFTGRGLNWDPYGHHPNDASDPLGSLSCTPDAYGYNTGFAASDPNFLSPPNASAVNAVNFWEWCQDHNKPLQVSPYGDVPTGGPATLPDPNILTNGAWYGGSPYLGPDAALRGNAPSCVTGNANPKTEVAANGNATCTNLAPANVQANPSTERGWAFMWHSHNEREITTNNVFPGGMLMMMLVDTREFVIDESM